MAKKKKQVSYGDMFRRGTIGGATNKERVANQKTGDSARADRSGADSPNIGIGKAKRLRTKYTPVVKANASIGQKSRRLGGYN